MRPSGARPTPRPSPDGSDAGAERVELGLTVLSAVELRTGVPTTGAGAADTTAALAPALVARAVLGGGAVEEAAEDVHVLGLAVQVGHLLARVDVGRLAAGELFDHGVLGEKDLFAGLDANDDPRVVVLDTNQASKFAPAVDRWLVAIREGSHTHDNDPDTNDHVKAAHLKQVRLADDPSDGRTRYVLVKGEERRKIDGAVADVLAFEAAKTMSPPKEKQVLLEWR